MSENFEISNLDTSPEMAIFLQDRRSKGYIAPWTFCIIEDKWNVLFDRVKNEGARVWSEPNNPTRFLFELQESEIFGICDSTEVQVYSKRDITYCFDWANKFCSDIAIGYGNNSKVELHLLSLVTGQLSIDSIHIAPEDFGDVRTDLYPTIDIIELYHQFVNSKENILILHGPPGTGKTSFIRYLMKHINTHNSDAIAYVKDKECISSPQLWNNLQKEKYSNLILDDADELLEPRQSTINEGLAQLLSFSDGVIRNNTKIIITTNQNIKEIDEALIRPGRCFDFLILEPMKYNYAKDIWVNALGNTEETFNKKFNGMNEVTQAALMSEHNRLSLDIKTRNYIKHGNQHYSIASKLKDLGINSYTKQKAGFVQ